MNPSLYTLLIQKKLPAAAAPKAKEIRYKVRKEVRKGRIVYIQTPILPEPDEEQPQPNYTSYR